MATHTVPRFDIQPHTLTADCPCEPSEEEWTAEGRCIYFVHDSFDDRESLEALFGSNAPTDGWRIVRVPRNMVN